MIAVSIVGARPQFVKLAPVHRALVGADVDHRVIHTGQHHDTTLSDVFFSGMELPDPTVNLGVGSASHGVQTGRMLQAIEASLLDIKPDVVVTYGDTNSTLAGVLAAAKLHIASVHVEAGLRSFDRRMPEEVNRITADHVSTLCLAPTNTAMDNLEHEGLADRAVLVGDVMLDVLSETAATVSDVAGADHVGVDEPYVLATLHRPQNTDDHERLAAIVRTLASFSIPVLLPVHPRLAQRAHDYGIELCAGAIRVIPPLSYHDLVATLLGARAVLTDSGGLQKEAVHLGITCTTIRSTTEWPETLAHGVNLLHYDLDGLEAAVLRAPPVAAGTRQGSPGASSLVAAQVKRAARQGYC